MSILQTSSSIEKNELKDILYFICSNNAKRCFLCFKTSEESVNIFLDFFIDGGQSYCKKSIYIIVVEIFNFNFQDLLSNEVCISCVEIILKVYKTLKRHEIIKKSIGLVLESLNREIEIRSNSCKNDDKQCKLKLNFPNDPWRDPTLSVTKSENKALKNFVSEKNICEDFYCQKLTSHFKELTSLKDHKSFVRKSSNHSKICETCGKVCKSSALLKAHLNCHKVRKCPHCLKLLKTHAHFYYHVKRHLTGVKRITSGNTVYKCHSCDYTSKNKKSLEAHHNKEHLHVRPYICEICSRGFYKRSNLVEHGRTHTKIKTNICHICGDSFVTSKCLKEHMRLHTGEKPYKCEQCNDSFLSASRRSEHVKRKHWEKSELCMTCGKRFALKKDLDRHVKNVHEKDKLAADNSPLRDSSAEINCLHLYNTDIG